MSGSAFDRMGQRGNGLLPASPQIQPQGMGTPNSLLADAWEKTGQVVGDARAQARAGNVAAGNLDPATGWPTTQGWQQAAGAYTNALIGGTMAPGMRGMPGANGLMETALASRTASIRPPAAMPARPFSADYPGAVPADASGRLLADMEGRPLTAPVVVGRRMAGEEDAALGAAELDAVGTGVTRTPPLAVPARQIGGNAGLYRHNGPEKGIYIDQRLSEGQAPQVVGHEVGHAIDETAGQIPVAGLSGELKALYNAGNNPQTYGKPWGPGQAGYKGDEVPRELMADAIRTYMADPNAMKATAPNTAAAIRKAVNGHPVLSKHIQFNSAVPLVGAGAGAAAAAAAPYEE